MDEIEFMNFLTFPVYTCMNGLNLFLKANGIQRAVKNGDHGWNFMWIKTRLIPSVVI